MLNNKDLKEMDIVEVISLLQLFEQNGLNIIINGGWGVDALLEKQTRPHKDLDIVLDHNDIPKLRKLLKMRGYKEVQRDDTRECNFVLEDDKGHEIDVHSYAFDPAGNNVFGVSYPLESLTGMGKINGRLVKCITPEWMVKFHSGYELDENDYRDVLALCQRFGISIPNEYEQFKNKK